MIDPSHIEGLIQLLPSESQEKARDLLQSHILITLDMERRWRRSTLELWIEILEADGRRQRFTEADELGQLNLVLDWIRWEMSPPEKNLEGSNRSRDQVTASDIFSTSQILLRQHPYPESRPFLVTIWRNRIRRPEYFTATKTAICLSLLEKLQVPHLQILRAIRPRPSVEGGDQVVLSFQKKKEITSSVRDGELAWSELITRGFLREDAQIRSATVDGSFPIRLHFAGYVAHLIELISDEAP